MHYCANGRPFPVREEQPIELSTLPRARVCVPSYAIILCAVDVCERVCIGAVSKCSADAADATGRTMYETIVVHFWRHPWALLLEVAFFCYTFLVLYASLFTTVIADYDCGFAKLFFSTILLSIKVP